MKKSIIIVGIILMVGVLGFSISGINVVKNETSVNTTAELPSKEVIVAEVVSPPKVEKPFSDWQKYNIDYMNDNIKAILVKKLGTNGKTAFYLPPIGYINVSRGSKFGVAYALNNPNPSGENFFEFDWIVDKSVVENCGVSEAVAQKWIERGWTSFGKIPQGWVDCMTIYFAFPSDIELCNVKYNFVIMKDGILYDTKSVEFNII